MAKDVLHIILEGHKKNKETGNRLSRTLERRNKLNIDNESFLKYFHIFLQFLYLRIKYIDKTKREIFYEIIKHYPIR